MKKCIIICGPTASGKTEFAHKVALKIGGEIINADSMQLYKQIPIITASPSAELTAVLPYHLYNFYDVTKNFSATKYVEMASDRVKKIHASGKLPIIVGGTGLYIDMLIKGYNQMPEIEDKIRTLVNQYHAKYGNSALYQQLLDVDPAIKSKLRESDTQRIIRAYEVLIQSGKSILYYQNQDKYLPLRDYVFEVYYLAPERHFLYATCSERFTYLFDHGAVQEVQQLVIDYPNLNSTASKALGIKQITDYLRGKVDRYNAINVASTLTRQYAKRQCTWFNHQIENKQVIRFSNKEEYIKQISNVLDKL
ncbi:MAG: tRNA (adenosine(37)-N6)-dimethylallyltransferase MiaA [Rickettsiaceae bacterium]|nr:tRNA (adenosine(37)-N6)-dimethylallyltransferase MiaA [Rickettsiaceae bacterium]